jgi:hypothetical protein
MPTKIDWARLAAYIDGEGSIFIRDRQPTETDIKKGRIRGHCLVICVANTDPRLVYWCKQKFDGCAYRTKRTSPGRGKYPVRAGFEWIIGQTKAAKILEACMPYFLLKREQAEIALAFQATVSRTANTRWKGGVSKELYQRGEAMRTELQRLKHVPLEHLKPN